MSKRGYYPAKKGDHQTTDREVKHPSVERTPSQTWLARTYRHRMGYVDRNLLPAGRRLLRSAEGFSLPISTYAFDEYRLWVDGHLPEGILPGPDDITGFSLIRHGHYAMRELRSYGQDNIWLCHGTRPWMADFDAFQRKHWRCRYFSTTSLSAAPLSGETYPLARSFRAREDLRRQELPSPIQPYKSFVS
jgi:hypothetical protein